MSTTTAAVNRPAAPRLDLAALLPEVGRAQLRLSQAAEQAWLDAGLSAASRELVLLRASQLNGCAYCLDMHSKDARHAGEEEQRLHLLSAWPEATCYDDTERAALALAEAITLVSVDHVPDNIWEAVTSVLTDAQAAAVIGVVVAINGWNRIAISSRMPPGTYQPA